MMRRAQVRRRAVPGEAPKPRTFREAAGAIKLGSKMGGLLGALKKAGGLAGAVTAAMADGKAESNQSGG